MNTKHTPGPWELFEHSWSESSIYAGEKNEKQICRLSIYNEATEENQMLLEKEMDANARLIAAAPELLEALQAVIERAESQHWDDASPQVIEQARQAIQKATTP